MSVPLPRTFGSVYRWHSQKTSKYVKFGSAHSMPASACRQPGSCASESGILNIVSILPSAHVPVLEWQSFVSPLVPSAVVPQAHDRLLIVGRMNNSSCSFLQAPGPQINDGKEARWRPPAEFPDGRRGRRRGTKRHMCGTPG